MIGFGMVELDGGVRSYAYDEQYGIWAKNPLLAQRLVSVTAGGGFGQPQAQRIKNDDYALFEVANVFAAVLQAPGGVDVVSNSTDPSAPTEEHATFVTTYPKYEIHLSGGRRALAGTIASIIGNDPAYGSDVPTKAGELAKVLQEPYNAAVHGKTMAALIAAANPWKSV